MKVINGINGELYFNYDGRWVKIMDVQGIEESRPETLQFTADTKHITDSFSFTTTSTLDSVNIPYQDRLNEMGDWLKQNKAKGIRLEDGKYIVTYYDGTEQVYEAIEMEKDNSDWESFKEKYIGVTDNEVRHVYNDLR